MDAPAGTLTVKDFPAPTCATCHMSGIGSVKGTHDVGERLKWKLAPEIAIIRANGGKNQANMNSGAKWCCDGWPGLRELARHLRAAEGPDRAGVPGR
jgi:hypothetical protein